MNIRESLIKAVLDPDVSVEKIRQSLCILQGRDMGKEKVTGYLSMKDAAEFLGGISRIHLWRLRGQGLPSYRLGSRVVFKTDELESWMDANCKLGIKKRSK